MTGLEVLLTLKCDSPRNRGWRICSGPLRIRGPGKRLSSNEQKRIDISLLEKQHYSGPRLAYLYWLIPRLRSPVEITRCPFFFMITLARLCACNVSLISGLPKIDSYYLHMLYPKFLQASKATTRPVRVTDRVQTDRIQQDRVCGEYCTTRNDERQWSTK